MAHSPKLVYRSVLTGRVTYINSRKIRAAPTEQLFPNQVVTELHKLETPESSVFTYFLF